MYLLYYVAAGAVFFSFCEHVSREKGLVLTKLIFIPINQMYGKVKSNSGLDMDFIYNTFYLSG